MLSQSNEWSTSERSDVEIAATSASMPTIIFLHGAVVNRMMWEPHMKILSQKYNIAAPDLPGHGSLIDQPFTLSEAVELVVELISEFANRPVILIGDSLGGYVAMAAAGKYPDKMSALIVSGCTKNYVGFWSSLLKLNTRVGQWAINVFGEERLANITKKKLRKKIDLELVDDIFDAGIRIQSRMEALSELVNRDFSSSLASFSKPVLFINGEKDRMNRLGEEQFVNAVKNANLRNISGADHFVALTHSEKYVEAITSFLKEDNKNLG